MELESVRALKEQAKLNVTALLQHDVVRRSLGVRAQSVDGFSRPKTIALGVARAAANDYKLAVRVQNALLLGGKEVASLRALAKNEVDIRYIGSVRAMQAPWNQGKCQPLRIGCSIAHFSVTAGTLGAFVQANGETMVLSNNHVLANENNAKVGDAILQPGPFDGGANPADAFATLTNFVPMDFVNSNRVDCAVGTISAGVNFDAKDLDQLGTLSGVRTSPLAIAEMVSKVGRTTGTTHGTITAAEMDNVSIGYQNGNAVFDNQIEIEGAGSAGFSQGGDSGSLVVDSSSLALGLLFAGSDRGGANGMGLTYANPIDEVFQALSVSLLI